MTLASPTIINRGRAELRARSHGGRTVIHHQYSCAPLQWLGPLDPSAQRPALYLRNPNGGLLKGDRQSIDISLESDSHLEIRSQSATRLHPGLSRQEVSISLGDRSSLIWIPHPMIPGTDTEFQQQVNITMAPSARLAYGEVWTAGRLSLHSDFAPIGISALEQWRFKSLENRLAITRDERPLVREAIMSEFPHAHLRSPGVLDKFTCWGSLYLIGDWPKQEWPASETQWTVETKEGDRILRMVGDQSIEIWEAFINTATSFSSIAVCSCRI